MPSRRRDLKREQFWRDHIRQHHASGQTIHAYCQSHQFQESHFYFWRRQIANRDQQSTTSSTSPVEAPAHDTVPTFVPVAVVNAPSTHELLSIFYWLDPRRSNRFDVSDFSNRIIVQVNGCLFINYVDTNPIRHGGVDVSDASRALRRLYGQGKY